MTMTIIGTPIDVTYNPRSEKWKATAFDSTRNIGYSAKARRPRKAVAKLLKLVKGESFCWKQSFVESEAEAAEPLEPVCCNAPSPLEWTGNTDNCMKVCVEGG